MRACFPFTARHAARDLPLSFGPETADAAYVAGAAGILFPRNAHPPFRLISPYDRKRARADFSFGAFSFFARPRTGGIRQPGGHAGNPGRGSLHSRAMPPLPQKRRKSARLKALRTSSGIDEKFLVEKKGFEPSTPALRRRCSPS